MSFARYLLFLQVLGECCSCVFAFSSREAISQTLITHLLIRWNGAAEQFYAARSNTVTADPSCGESTAGRIIPLSVDDTPAKTPILLQENAIASTKDPTLSGKSLQPSQRGSGSHDEPLRDRTNVLEDRETAACEQAPDSLTRSHHGHEYRQELQPRQAPTDVSNSGGSEEPCEAPNRASSTHHHSKHSGELAPVVWRVKTPTSAPPSQGKEPMSRSSPRPVTSWPWP